MTTRISRRAIIGAATIALLAGAGLSGPAAAQDKITLRMSTPASETDFRSQGLATIFADGVSEFAVYEPHYNDSLFKQGTELVAIARDNLEMSITSAQELAKLIPEWSIFTAGYLMRDAAHQRAVFEGDIGKEMYQLAEDKLGVKLLSVMYFGTRQLNLRGDKKINTPDDLAGIKLRMPGTDAWQFLGRALGANSTPMASTEIYTELLFSTLILLMILGGVLFFVVIRLEKWLLPWHVVVRGEKQQGIRVSKEAAESQA